MNRIHIDLFCVILALVLAARPAAGGVIVVTEQTRGISASGHAASYNQPPVDVYNGVGAEDFLLFDQTISAHPSSLYVAGDSSAWQRSQWTDRQITAAGTASATAYGNGPSVHPASSSSSAGSSFRVVFVLDSPETVELSGEMSATFQTPATFSGSVSLSSATAEIVGHVLPMHFASGDTLPFADVLALEAGQYTLTASCQGGASATSFPAMGANSAAAFSTSLQIVPEPSLAAEALIAIAFFPLLRATVVRKRAVT
jgi:hypothetical protein